MNTESINPIQNTDIIVGLDIGTTKIAVLVGVKNEKGKIEILGMGKAPSLGVRRGVVANIEQTVQAIRTAVEEAEKKSGVEIKSVHVGIAGQHIKSLKHSGSRIRENVDVPIVQKDVDSLIDSMYKLVMLPGEEIIHVLPQEYTIDSESGIKNPIGHEGVRLEANFHIITGQMAAAKNIKKCVEKAGLQVIDLILEPIASSSAVLSEEEKEAGVALVDIGGGTTDIAIFYDKIIRHTAVIPFGGNVITDDIKEGCSILAKYAEELKIKFGSALAKENQDNEIIVIPGLKGRTPKEISTKNLASIIEARMKEILDLVAFEIKNSGFERKLAAGVVVTGGGAQLRHMKQLVEYCVGMDTRIGYPNEHLSKGAEDVTSPLFSTGVGLVLQGFDELEVEKSRNTHPHAEIITTHSKKMRGNFFDSLFSKTKKLFDEGDDEFKE
ncbi:MAG TPA: cell division protein FtsA [Bacteroidia bacterium]|jgi:cell division protein FtsA|nr:cell division protein FtsA [Bacteroidia bacterium]